jgi:DNA-binding transcriptional MerR regulator
MLKSSDIAKELHISEQTVRAYARDGLIPFVETPGGHRRYVLEDVRAALYRAKAHKFAPLDVGEQIPRLSQETPAAPFRRARRTRRHSTGTIIAESHGDASAMSSIPFIGVSGSSRFVVGRGAAV